MLTAECRDYPVKLDDKDLSMKSSYDFVVIGAGAFGAWTAYYLRQSGASVALLDAYGAANSRASSGGETRIIRMGYGPDELYTRWSVRSLPLWRELFQSAGVELFLKTGVLWLTNPEDQFLGQLTSVLSRCGVPFEKLTAAEVRRRYPQLAFGDNIAGVLERESGVLMARQSVQVLMREAVKIGVEYSIGAVVPPATMGKLDRVHTIAGDAISGGNFVFACGPWLPKLFPDLLEEMIRPTRQEVFFLGAPAGNDLYLVGHMPAWLHHNHPDRPYILPDIESRGVKIALDTHGPPIDPDTASRTVSDESWSQISAYVKEHLPALANAPVVEARVCQYENSSNGDFLIDRHPQLENVWIAGGGSGHGFKHGPAVGEYLAARILDNAPEEPRFAFASKSAVRKREVF